MAAVATTAAAKGVTAQLGRKGHNVQIRTGEDLCFFENFDDSWCIAATPPMVKSGWEFSQAYTSTSGDYTLNYYHLQLLPYLEIQANLISTLFV